MHVGQSPWQTRCSAIKHALTDLKTRNGILQSVFLWPQWNETKTQQQKEIQEIHKYGKLKYGYINNQQVKEKGHKGNSI